jgi:DNA modification methylase
MTLPQQLSLFEAEDPEESFKLSRANLGTFQDSLRAPVHSWFTYPAGFSYKAVDEALRLYKVRPGMVVYDPFAGTATTNVVASQRGIDSIGIEAHPFIYFVAQTKVFWEFDFSVLTTEINRLIARIRDTLKSQSLSSIEVERIFPELVCKCYRREKLAALYLCREAIMSMPASPFRNFAKLGLTSVLRSAADVATGWPYIAPQKAKKNNSNGKSDVVSLFQKRLHQMVSELKQIYPTDFSPGKATIIYGDARERQDRIEADSIHLTFTSPPYLNNYDYADRTRLEMYFWGEANTWGDITREVRTRLMMSATTQINRSDYDTANLLSEDLVAAAPTVTGELRQKIRSLSELRLKKGGKKSYDIMVGGYFNDMICVLQETFRVLAPGSAFVLILGDSAPYGVYIPTHTYLGDIGLAIGFSDYSVEQLRTRGGKWKANPQRHKVALQECILTLRKK